jgi:hypothetical protein
VAAEPRLRARLESVLRRKLAEGRPSQLSIAMDIRSFSQFSRAISETARTAVIQHRRHAPAHPPEGLASMELPRLQGFLSPFGDNDAEAGNE